MLDLSEIRNGFKILRQSVRAWGLYHGVPEQFHYYRAMYHEKVDRFDAQFGTETSRMVGIENLGGIGEHQVDAIHYWPTRPNEFDQMMAAVGDVDFRDYAFIDFGCGKGRVVLLAAGLPFKTVIGVDFSPDLIERAKQNVASYSGPVRAAEVELVVSDAAEFQPPAEHLVVYLFDPFGPRVLSRVLANLLTAAREGQRELLLVYYAPENDDVVLEAGFKLIANGKGTNFGWHVYTPAEPTTP